MSKIYEKIEISISLVEVSRYEEKNVENGSMELTLIDVEPHVRLQNGAVVEGSRKVEVVLRSNEGYYISGKEVTDHQEYKKEMKFKDFEDIVAEHSIQKNIQITFDNSDEYGDCVFKVDKEEVSGEKLLREGQEITLEYTLTDSDYQIVRESEGFRAGIKSWREETFSKNKTTITIPVTEELDGETLTRNQYITVDKK